MKLKNYIFILVFILLVCSILYLGTRNLTIYIGIANSSKNIDAEILIDDTVIYNDTLKYNPYEYKIIKKKLKRGFHTIKINSNKGEVTLNDRFFVILNQHLVVEYYPKSDMVENSPLFWVRNRFTKFYLE